jgi:predicted amidophosphoribosyltransferase
MVRERKTVEAMIGLYCQKHHAPQDLLCSECQDLLQYALERLARCPFQARKTTCAKCPVHCYRPELRERIREVMRYAGPRMLFRHPILALFHLWDGIRKAPTSQ